MDDVKDDVVNYDRISQDPTKFEAVFSRQLSLADELRQGKIEPDRGNVEGKALHGATRTLGDGPACPDIRAQGARA